MTAFFRPGLRIHLGRRVAGLLGAAAVIAGLLLPPVAPGYAQTAAASVAPSSVTIIDDSDSIDDGELEDLIADIDFPRAFDLVILGTHSQDLVYSSPGTGILEYSRLKQLGWESPTDSRALRDSLVVIVMPMGQRATIFASDDLGLPEDLDEQVYDAVDLDYSATRAQIIALYVRSIADVSAGGEINTGSVDEAGVYHPVPFETLVGFRWLLAGSIAAAVAGVAAFAYLALRARVTRQAAREFSRARGAYAELSFQLDALDVNVATLPASSKYAKRLRRDVHTFEKAYREATKRIDALEDLSRTRSLKPEHLAEVRNLVTITETASDLEERIAFANSILNRYGDWETAWLEETTELAQAAAEVDLILRECPEVASSPSGRDLRIQGEKVADALPSTLDDLRSGKITPDKALEVVELLGRTFGRAEAKHFGTMLEFVSTSRRYTDESRARVLAMARGQQPKVDGIPAGHSVSGTRQHFASVAGLVELYRLERTVAKPTSRIGVKSRKQAKRGGGSSDGGTVAAHGTRPAESTDYWEFPGTSHHGDGGSHGDSGHGGSFDFGGGDSGGGGDGGGGGD
ncbi:DUF5129 domain-containing protein [Micrococcales bacterium 31B]|nr:DUF5129 domain-containing protein [Micrococcales bacterium 31B]